MPILEAELPPEKDISTNKLEHLWPEGVIFFSTVHTQSLSDSPDFSGPY